MSHSLFFSSFSTDPCRRCHPDDRQREHQQEGEPPEGRDTERHHRRSHLTHLGHQHRHLVLGHRRRPHTHAHPSCAPKISIFVFSPPILILYKNYMPKALSASTAHVTIVARRSEQLL